MKVKELTVEVRRTINLGNYENVQIGLTEKIALEEPAEVGSKRHKTAVATAFDATVHNLEKLIQSYVDEEDDD